MSDLLDLNQADMDDLTELEGIGEVRAEQILNFREENGKFIDTEELLAVAGIGRKTYEKIEYEIRCGNVQRPRRMTRETYRRRHRAEIQQARSKGHKLDVCHIIAEHRQGADHEDNYVLAGARFNRSIGDRHDELMMALVGPEETKKAIRVSRLQKDNPLTVDEADYLVDEGYETFKSQHFHYLDELEEDIDCDDFGNQLDPSRVHDSGYCKWIREVWEHKDD